MPTIVIIGLKIAYRNLWKKTGTVEKSACNCPVSQEKYSYCPHCGTRKRKQNVKLYSSLITGEESTYRNIEAQKEFLQQHNISIYDNTPRGYTDDPVYIYFTDPLCFIESVAGTPTTSPKLNKALDKVEDWLYDFLGDELWKLGEWGIWVIENKETISEPQPHKPTPPITINNEPRAFIIPLGPHLDN